MGTLTTVQLREPYLVLVGDETDVTYAKTASGLVHWRREAVAGQLRFSDDAVDLGVADMSIEDAAREGVGSLVVGVAPVGGAVPAILFNTPGTPDAFMTTFDGYPMAQRGEPERALAGGVYENLWGERYVYQSTPWGPMREDLPGALARG